MLLVHAHCTRKALFVRTTCDNEKHFEKLRDEDLSRGVRVEHHGENITCTTE